MALALGMLVGSERGWRGRALAEGTRVAGIRTFALIGLFGGLIGVAGTELPLAQRWLMSGLAFLPVSALLIAGYARNARAGIDVSITTEVAAMMTFWLGTLPAFGLPLPAAASAVVLALVLHLKDRLHHWLQRLEHAEVLGALQFLLVSVVLLPLLPNRGFGPWSALNPWEIWWMVVLISGLSLLGYFATRIGGARQGILATSLTGGLVSSTAVTLSLSRMHRELGNTELVAAGILLACATMFLRILVVVSVIRSDLTPNLLLPMALGLAALLGWAWYYWRSARTLESLAAVAKPAPETEGTQPPAVSVRNPFQLVPALQFGTLLALVMLAVDALQHWFGHAGLYLLSVFTGLADVDAIVLSLSPRAGDQLAVGVVITCICLAAATNSVIKGIYSAIIAGPGLGLRVLGPALLAALGVTLGGLAGGGS